MVDDVCVCVCVWYRRGRLYIEGASVAALSVAALVAPDQGCGGSQAWGRVQICQWVWRNVAHDIVRVDLARCRVA